MAESGERRFRGLPASPGLASGQANILAVGHSARVPASEPGTEAAGLSTAIARALAEIETLRQDASGETAEALAFQAAALSGEKLSRHAFVAIAEGTGADHAWTAAVDADIACHASSDDEGLRARVSDLIDLRERVRMALAVADSGPIRPGSIVVADDLPPSRFLAPDFSEVGAILLTQGSAAGHLAVLARSRSLPMVVGIGGRPADLVGEVLVDGGEGQVVVAPTPETWTSFKERVDAEARQAAHVARYLPFPAVARSGERIWVGLNLSDPDERNGIDPSHIDGVGLVRTEFLFRERTRLAGEEAQFGIYRLLAEWAGGRPVAIRTLDAGGDKSVPGITAENERNPFLGLRGIRFSLQHADLLKTQLRAMARAAAYGQVRILVPMVTLPAEVQFVRKLLDQAIDELAAEGRPHARPSVGIMIEVPATALALDRFDADFFSIGSNDLVQYATAAGRDIAAVADLADPLHPGVIRMIRSAVEQARTLGREISLCGDAGGDPVALPHLLATGLRAVSVAPAAFARTKAAISELELRPWPASEPMQTEVSGSEDETFRGGANPPP